jgi:hypothetical protein
VTALFGDAKGLAPDVLDEILTLQLLVAWAGEGETDPPRLGWWRTSMVEEFGGEDLFRRLLPHTWPWAVLEAVREAAKRVDARGREATSDADQLVSLFRLGFTLDEQLDDRFRALKRSGDDPQKALPGLKPLQSAWDEASFAHWLSELGAGEHTGTPSGRRLTGAPPESPVVAARALCAALAPLADSYPAPYFRLGR